MNLGWTHSRPHPIVSIQFNSAGNIRQKQVTKDEGMENIPGPDMIKVRIFTGQLHESAGR